MAAKAYSAFPNGKGLVDGAQLNDIFQGRQSTTGQVLINPTVTGASSTGATETSPSISNPTFSGYIAQALAAYTAAGATQGTATALTTGLAIITVALTASTKGVKLPTPATGRMVWVVNRATFGVKVYAGAAGQSIGAGTTCTTADTVLAINKANCYIASSATKWTCLRGA